jgi:hypothetical protein
MALYVCMTTLMTIMRKQWVDYERLSFPIAQVPQELCAVAEEPWGASSIFRRKLFWLGIALPFVVGSLRAAHTYYYQVPVVPVATSLRGFGPIPLQLRISFAVLGFTFLVPNHVAFSLWALNLASFAFRSTLREYGLEMQENLGLYGAVESPTMAHQGMGAMLVFAFASLYFSRHHFKKVVLCALGKGHKGYDKDEPSSYLLALILLCASLLVTIGWLWLAGLPLFHAAFLVAAGIVIFYGLTRVVAQCGVSVITPPMIAPVFLTSTLGGASITSGGIGALTQSWSWSSDIRTSVMSSAAHGMYLTRRKGRGLFAALMLAAIITFATSTAATIWLGYRYGAANLDRWFFIAGPPYTFNWGLHEVTTSQPPNFTGYVWTLVGGIIMVSLTVAHRLLFWWPLHPVGFIICSVDWMDRLWATIFLAWAVKAIVTKVAGNRGLRMARPFFVGTILGHFTVSGVWVIIDTIAQTTDNSIFWI